MKITNRPWGSFKTIFLAPGIRVKVLTILPGARFSLQYHRHRSEGMTCVAGKGVVERNGNLFRFSTIEGQQYIFISAKDTHRVKNTGSVPLKIIEIQCGKIVAESDIVRIADDFGRVKNEL